MDAHGHHDNATDTLGHIHDRSRLLLPQDRWDDWLDPELGDADDVEALFASIPEPHLTPVKVGVAVGNVPNDYPELVHPVE